MYSRVSKSVGRLLALACVVSIPLALGAQDSAKPASKAAVGDSASKWDIFAGYSFFAPNTHVDGTTPYGLEDTVKFATEKVGSVESVSRYFNEHLGLQIDSGQHDLYNNAKYSTTGSNSGIYTVQGGLVYRWPKGKITPWVHVLAGGGALDGPDHQAYTPGFTATGGGGLDYSLTRHWAIRGEGDYEYMYVNYGAPHHSATNGWQAGGTANIEGIRLVGGIVYRIGSITPPPPVTLACSASPVSVFPGDPVTVTATAGNLDPKLNAIYSWSGTGVTGNGTTAAVATGSLAPGTYTVKCGVKEGKPGKEGLKPWESAEGSASFTVKAFEPPTISCAVSPTTIKPGDTANATATAVSPQNRPLTYSYAASAGSIQGNGATAIFSSVGAPTGPVTITCNVSDDKGQSASATSSLSITAPYVAPVPHTQALCSISFATDKQRPTRVNNEAKACLDEVALDLQKQSDAKAVVVGASDAKEKEKLAKEEKLALKHKHLKVVDPAAERAVNTKDYLVSEKGIDASRISVVTSATDAQTVEDYLVPSGASFTADVAGTTPVDEAAVKAQPRKPMHVAHKKAAAKSAAKKDATPAK